MVQRTRMWKHMGSHGGWAVSRIGIISQCCARVIFLKLALFLCLTPKSNTCQWIFDEESLEENRGNWVRNFDGVGFLLLNKNSLYEIWYEILHFCHVSLSQVLWKLCTSFVLCRWKWGKKSSVAFIHFLLYHFCWGYFWSNFFFPDTFKYLNLLVKFGVKCVTKFYQLRQLRSKKFPTKS